MYFVTSEPVYGEFFYNRKGEIRLLQAGIRDITKGIRRFYAIYGLRKVGKTSLLTELARRLENKRNIIIVIFDCSSNLAEGNIFFEELATQIIDRFLIHGSYFKETGLLAASKLDEGEFIATIGRIQNVGSQALREGIKAVLRIRGQRKGDREAYKTIVELPHKLHAETGKHFLIIMDEFQACSQLNNFSSIKASVGEFFAFLRSFWQKQKGVNYFITGSQISMLEKIVYTEESPFFQHFNALTLREFPAADARQMVHDLFRRSGYTLNKGRMNLLLEITNCHPFYLQVLGEEICKASSRKKVSPAAFKEAVQDTLFNSTGRLFLYFQDLYGKCTRNSSGVEKILISIANDNHSSSEIARDLNLSTGEIGSLVLRLMALDVIFKEKQKYFFRDPVFAHWIKGTKSPWKTKMAPVLIGTEAEKAIAEKLSREGFNLVYQSKASRGAFDLLAVWDVHKVGLQIKVFAKFPFYLKIDEFDKMTYWGKKLEWVPILCLYQKARGETQYYRLENLRKAGKSYRIGEDTQSSERLLPILFDNTGR